MNILLLRNFNSFPQQVKESNQGILCLQRIVLLFTLHSLLFTILMCGCIKQKKDEVVLTSEPSIERALDILSDTNDGKKLIKFLMKNPIMFEYSNTEGDCHKFNLKARRIYISRNFKSSEFLLTLELARAAYVYRLHSLIGLDNIISEQEEIASLFQSRMAIQLNAVSKDFENAEYAKEIFTEFCTYLMEGTKEAMQSARNHALSSSPECQRPLETLNEELAWFEKIKQAVTKENLFQLLYERDLQKVKKGILTMSDAIKNDAKIRALPMYEIYRYQRAFYESQIEKFSKLKKIHKMAQKKEEEWLNSHKSELQKSQMEFSNCNLSEIQ